MAAEPTDRELVNRVTTSGDATAFGTLVERHQQAVRCFLRRLTAGDVSAADDLAQETFLAAFNKLHTWRATAALSTWLHSIAYRQFLSMVRKQSRMEVMADVPEPDDPILSGADDEIMAQTLLGLLGEEDRACLTLAYGAGMSHADIAQIINQPLGSVKSRIHRAKLKLQKWLKEHDHTLQTPEKNVPRNGDQRNAG